MNTRIDKFKVKRLMGGMEGIETLEDLAELAGVHSNTIYRVLDSYKWKSATLDAIAGALGCNPKDILTVDEVVPDTQQLALAGLVPAMA